LAQPSRNLLFDRSAQSGHPPNDFPSLRELEDRLIAFQRRYEQTAQPFQWAFTRGDLAALLSKLKAKALANVA